ncbi:MAG: exodeoxyribonuclease III [Methylophilaceae bacterium]|jgi:exodeoxyribonuclease-3|nr:exodeoxyribonuclease III [Methylophilaceae bacterium]
MRIITLNLNGIRSATKKGFYPWLYKMQPDVICLQELKAQADNLTEEMQAPDGYHGNFHYAQKKGYSGVGIYSKKKPDEVIVGLGIEDIDFEGRYLECRFGKLSVISLYLPSGSSGEERQNYKFSVLERFMTHVEKLIKSGFEVVICGDWNIAHQEIDLKNYKGNKKNSGFLPEERVWMTDLFDRVGWIDVYRAIYPDTTGDAYTWWSNRGQAWANNVGWRIDYQIATPTIASKIKAASVYKDERFSDHAPLIMDYEE